MMIQTQHQVSTATICHCTSSFGTLIKIIESKYFRPNYCEPEEMCYLSWNKVFPEENCDSKLFSHIKLSFPIVCFTDLPKHIRQQHQSKYGNYLIEMKEDWKIRNNVQPVWYLCGNLSSLAGEDNRVCSSFLPNVLRFAKERIDEINTYYSKQGEERHYENFINLLLPFFKVYHSFDKNKIRYYDEREWRYLATGIHSDSHLTPIYSCLDEEQWNSDIRREAEQILWGDKKNMLYFEWDDIEQIEVTTIAEKRKLKAIIETEYKLSPKEITKKIHINNWLSIRQMFAPIINFLYSVN